MNLDALLELWGKLWAQKRGSKEGATRVEYSKEEVDKYLKPSSQFFNHHYHLEIRPLNETAFQFDFDSTEIASTPNIRTVKIASSGENRTSNPSQFNGEAEISWESTCTVTHSKERELNFLGKLGAEAPFIELEVSAGLAFRKTKSQTDSETKAIRNKQGYNIECPPGKILEAFVEYVEKAAKTKFSLPVALAGHVVVWCKKAVEDKISGREGKHLKWAIPIERVYDDLVQFEKDTQIDEQDRHLIAEGLALMQKNAQKKVHLTLTGEVAETRLINCYTRFEEKAIPGAPLSLPLAPALLSTERGQQLASGRIIARFSIIAEAKNSQAIKVIGQEDYNQERQRQFLEAMQQALPGDSLFFDSIHVTGEGALGVMLPNETLNPSVTAFLERMQSTSKAQSSLSIEVIAQAFHVPEADLLQALQEAKEAQEQACSSKRPEAASTASARGAEELSQSRGPGLGK